MPLRGIHQGSAPGMTLTQCHAWTEACWAVWLPEYFQSPTSCSSAASSTTSSLLACNAANRICNLQLSLAQPEMGLTGKPSSCASRSAICLTLWMCHQSWLPSLPASSSFTNASAAAMMAMIRSHGGLDLLTFLCHSIFISPPFIPRLVRDVGQYQQWHICINISWAGNGCRLSSTAEAALLAQEGVCQPGPTEDWHAGLLRRVAGGVCSSQVWSNSIWLRLAALPLPPPCQSFLQEETPALAMKLRRLLQRKASRPS